MKKLGICSDHAGYELKEYLKQVLDEKGIAYQDFGTYSAESSDYPDFAHPMALAVEAGEVYPGIAMCGSGNGIAMTLNKHQGIRAAISWEAELARLGRAHNDANVVVLPARFISREEAKKVIEAFLETPFEGGRHEKRICKIPV
ncbi:MAG: ribose 5-phosphate isomerase B [Parabacteroides sp.]|jgi:ribose 5-phosphate isomerase B|nr:ribose 5-phosphate isomerase B [Parabacteroides sp.]MBP8759894.1 ribose 5-phosphate isomerase B [Parabacteroides sp.]MBP9579675.1 ribose 5-phosphate isomerase B [Parabacteroides sp.]